MIYSLQLPLLICYTSSSSSSSLCFHSEVMKTSTSTKSGHLPSSSMVIRLTNHLTTAGAFLLYNRRGLTSEDCDWLITSHMSEVPAVHRTALRQNLSPYVSVCVVVLCVVECVYSSGMSYVGVCVVCCK